MKNEIKYPRTLDSRADDKLSYITADPDGEGYIVCFGGIRTRVCITTYKLIYALMEDDFYGTARNLTLCNVVYYIKQMIHLNHLGVEHISLCEKDIASIAHDLCYLYLILYQPDVEQTNLEEEENNE